MIDRRSFIGGFGAAALLTRFTWAAEENQIRRIGLELYTVRHALERDFEGTLSQVAKIGYREVEFARYFADPKKLNPLPQRTRQILDSDGLSAPATHVPYSALSPDLWPRVIEASQILGHQYVVNPSIDKQLTKTADGWKQAAETFNRAGAESLRAGIQFGYHNHTGEFRAVDGRIPYEILLSECDPHLVKMEMDLGWAHVAGVDPLRYFSRYPGRFPVVHVKDFDENGQMTEVGHGIIDWKRIFAQSDVAGIKHYFVEHDDPQSPLASIQTSYEYLKNLRF